MKQVAAGMRLLVADGSHARVFRNDGDALAPKFVVVRVYDQENPPSHELGSERPGRVNDSLGHRSAMQVPDYHQAAEDRFIKRIAGDMEKDLAAGSFKTAIVVMPPVALGTFRKARSEAVGRAVVLEIDKDLTKHTIGGILEIVEGALAKA